MSTRHRTLTLVGFLLFYLLPHLLLLGLPAIGGSSEAREAQVVDVISRTGEWVLPLRNGIVPSKPPLFHWAAALVSGLVGGVSEFTVRLPSAFAAGGMLVLTGWMAFLLPSGGDPVRRAVLAMVLLTSCSQFLRLTGDARVDMFFAFWVTLSHARMLSAMSRHSSDLPSRVWCELALCVGFAALAKGPLGIALPAISLFSLFGTTRGWSEAWRLLLRPRLAWLVGIAVVLPWYLVAALRGGEGFVARQLVFENVERLVGGADVNAEPFWFYLGSLLSSAPILVLCAGVAWARRLFRGCSALERGLMVAFTLEFLLLSVAQGKRHSYLLPLLPLLCIPVAGCFATLGKAAGIGQRLWQDRLSNVLRTVLIALAVIGFSLLELLPAFAAHDPLVAIGFEFLYVHRLPFLVVFSLALLTVAAGGGAAPLVRWCSLWAGGMALVTIGLYAGFGIKAELKGFGVMADRINAIAGSAPLSVYKGSREEYFDPILYYVKRAVVIRPSEGRPEPCEGYFIARRAWLEQHTAPHRRAIVPLGTLGTRLEEVTGRFENEIVVAKCDPSALL